MSYDPKPCKCGAKKGSGTAECRKCFNKRKAAETSANPRYRCACGAKKDRRAERCDACRRARMTQATPAAQVAADQEKIRQKLVVDSLNARYKEALRTIEQQRAALGWLDQIRAGVDTTFTIKPRERSATSEATPVIVMSDWHSEELVRPASVSGLNEFNPEIEERRVTRLFQASLNLIKNHLNPGVTIHTVVLALLGDFITNDIHEAENAETNALLPIDAIIHVQGQLIAGIEFLLNHSKYEFVIPCKVGNHSRTTRRVRFGAEAGHSLESLMYAHLAAYFRGEKRVRFVIDDGYHTYLNVYDRTIRFHHGHAIQYQGGIGGLFIPAFKAISQWSKARRVDLDVFGHFHQSKDGGNFICNGSLIGYNAFALSIKADFEPPQQTLFLIDKKRGRTCNWPILVGQEGNK